MMQVERGKVSVWEDILIISVLTKSIVELATKQYITSPSYMAFVLLALVAFLALRSRMFQRAIRSGLSMVAIGVFSMEIFYTEGSQTFASVMVLVILLFGLYVVLGRIFPGLR